VGLTVRQLRADFCLICRVSYIALSVSTETSVEPTASVGFRGNMFHFLIPGNVFPATGLHVTIYYTLGYSVENSMPVDYYYYYYYCCSCLILCVQSVWRLDLENDPWFGVRLTADARDFISTVFRAELLSDGNCGLLYLNRQKVYVAIMLPIKSSTNLYPCKYVKLYKWIHYHKLVIELVIKMFQHPPVKYCHVIEWLDGVWIGNLIYLTLWPLATTLYQALSHTD
jgi:hypothetical protein